MSKFLLPLLAAAAVILPFSKAEAGDHHHHHYRGGYCGPRAYVAPVVVYRDDYYRPYYRRYCPPRPVYYSRYDCDPGVRVVVARPRFAFSFGF